MLDKPKNHVELCGCPMKFHTIFAIALIVFVSIGSIGTVFAETKYLNVPYVGQGSAPVCVSATVTMILQYWGVKATLQGVLGKIGYPPITLNRVEGAVESYGLTFDYIPYSSIEHLEHWIDRGVPVMVQQVDSETNLVGHMRVVIGYDDSQRQIITQDSAYGPHYYISYDRFALLWKDLVKYVYPNNPLNESYIIAPANLPASMPIITISSSTTTDSTSLILITSQTTMVSTSSEPVQASIQQTQSTVLTTGNNPMFIEYVLGAIALIAISAVIAYGVVRRRTRN